MSEFGPEDRAMFRRARQDFEPSGSERDRNARALAARLGIGAGALAGSLSAASASAAGGAASGVTSNVTSSLAVLAGKWLAVGLLVGASVVSGVVAVQSRSKSAQIAIPSASVQHPLAVLKAQNGKQSDGASAAVESPSATPVSPEPAIRTPAATQPAEAPAPAPTLGSVSEETRLLRSAHEALQRGSFVYALQLLDELARRYPNGALTEERSAERISALCKLGRTEQAREEAARFLSSTPGSPLAKRVKASCGAPLAESAH